MESERDITESWQDDADYPAHLIGDPCPKCDVGIFVYDRGQKQTYDDPPIAACLYCSCCHYEPHE